jgi:hypothetical protein
MCAIGVRASTRPLVLVEARGPRVTHHKTILVTPGALPARDDASRGDRADQHPKCCVLMGV